MSTKQTIFHDVRHRAIAVYRVKTRGGSYIVGIHEAEGRKFAVIRGEPGTDREHVAIRDSDPRVGRVPLFNVPVEQWIGKELELASMTSSPIISAEIETDPNAIAAVGLDGKLERNPWARPDPNEPPPRWTPPPPEGMSSTPRIHPVQSKGTHPAAMLPPQMKNAGSGPAVDPNALARQVVVGQQAGASPAEPQLPYPQRHVGYAESAASLLRSIAKRDRLFEDLAKDKALRDRLRRALDDCALLLEQVRRRDRT